MSRIRADRYTNREGTGAPTFSDGVNVVGVTSMSGDLAVTNGTITGPSQLTISGITSSISDTAVDVFVYDTSKDSDGGAWRKRTQNTSWYNETLNTATRGSRREFPAVAVIVAETGQVAIYDGDDPDLPMWMVINHSGAGINATTAKNGVLYWGCSNASSDRTIYFVKDKYYRWWTTSQYTGYFNEPVSGRNGTLTGGSGDTQVLINGATNDVAMTVLPNAPIDSDTKLPVPTLAVATDGGISVIKDDGTVANNSRTANETYSIAFDVDNSLIFSWGTTDGFPRHITRLISNVWSVTSTNTSLWPNNYFSGYNEGLGNSAGSTGGASGGVVTVANSGRHFGIDYGTGGNPDDRLGILHPKNLTNYVEQNLSAFITSSYNTGYMNGAIQLATLSDTDATNQTGGTVADRSVNNNSVNVTGTITRTPVATGADLVAYSGFSASNYLEQPYNSALAPGTGIYSVVAWFKTGPTTADQYIFDRSSDGSPRALMLIRASNSGNPNTIQFYHQNAAGDNTDLTTTDITVTDDVWHQVVGLFDGSVYRLYVDGRASAITGSPVRDVDNTDSPVLKIGIRYSNTAPITGNIALFRYSKSAPSPEQIKKMYEDEKYLFQENSQATLYGSSNLPTALAYDYTTELLHVGTSAGRSEFQGLVRINNTTVGITSAISASNELVAEQ